MKNMIKIWIPLVLTCILLSMSVVPAYADSQPTPRYTNTIACEMAFTVNANGAHVVATYETIQNTFFSMVTTNLARRKVFWMVSYVATTCAPLALTVNAISQAIVLVYRGVG